ncbi:MAG: hypothetical protein R2932_38925 [Caldilineaceae bacterium]
MSGRLTPQMLYTHEIPLAQIAEAFALLQERPPEFLKALVVMDDTAPRANRQVDQTHRQFKHVAAVQSDLQGELNGMASSKGAGS